MSFNSQNETKKKICTRVLVANQRPVIKSTYVPANMSSWKNRFREKKTLQELLSTTSQAHEKKLWICGDCKYPACSVCSKSRVPNSKNRFQSWTCDECSMHEKPQPDKPPCAFCDVRPVHAIAHNSWVSKEDYFQRASIAHPRAAAAFAFFCCL